MQWTLIQQDCGRSIPECKSKILGQCPESLKEGTYNKSFQKMDTNTCISLLNPSFMQKVRKKVKKWFWENVVTDGQTVLDSEEPPAERLV